MTCDTFPSLPEVCTCTCFVYVHVLLKDGSMLCQTSPQEVIVLFVFFFCFSTNHLYMIISNLISLHVNGRLLIEPLTCFNAYMYIRVHNKQIFNWVGPPKINTDACEGDKPCKNSLWQPLQGRKSNSGHNTLIYGLLLLSTSWVCPLIRKHHGISILVHGRGHTCP